MHGAWAGWSNQECQTTGKDDFCRKLWITPQWSFTSILITPLKQWSVFVSFLFFDWLLSKNQAGSSLSGPLQTFFSPSTLSSCPWKLLNCSQAKRCIIYPLGSLSTPVVPPSLHCPTWKWEIRSCSQKKNSQTSCHGQSWDTISAGIRVRCGVGVLTLRLFCFSFPFVSLVSLCLSLSLFFSSLSTVFWKTVLLVFVLLLPFFIFPSLDIFFIFTCALSSTSLMCVAIYSVCILPQIVVSSSSMFNGLMC